MLVCELCWLGCGDSTNYSKPWQRAGAEVKVVVSIHCCKMYWRTSVLALKSWFIYLFIFPNLAILGNSLCCLHACLIWLFSHFCLILIFGLVVVLFILNSEKPFVVHTKTVWSSSCCTSLSLYTNIMILWTAAFQIEDAHRIFLCFSHSKIGTNHVKCLSDVSVNLR